MSSKVKDMDHNEFEKMADALNSSSGHKKYVNYIRALVDTKEFQDFVVAIRAKYEIPAGGFKNEQQTIPPTEWEHRHKGKHRELTDEIEKFAQKNHLHRLDEDVLSIYVFYNEIEFPFSPNAYNLCTISDVLMEKEEPFSEEIQKDDDRLYPIAIRVSPYASLRDILDFIKKTYKYHISELQNKYKEKGVKIGKVKARRSEVRERNSFIYENRHLPRRKISQMIIEKFGSRQAIDYGYIGKIISLEKKKRKEV